MTFTIPKFLVYFLAGGLSVVILFFVGFGVWIFWKLIRVDGKWIDW